MTGQKPLHEMKPEELTHLIDPSLSIIEEFHGSTKVCLVENIDNDLSILKVGMGFDPRLMNKGRFAYKHVKNELKVLEKLAGIPGIPILYSDYIQKGSKYQSYVGILKEYILGKQENVIKHTTEFQENMKELIGTLTEKNVILKTGTHEFSDHNIIVTNNYQPYLIDLGYALMPKKVDRKLKQVLKKQNRLFKKKYFPDIK